MGYVQRVIREYKIVTLDDGSVTLIIRVDDGTATIIENKTMQEIADYIACCESIEQIRIGA